MTSTREERIEQRYAELERKNEGRKAATIRRGPVSLIAVCLGLALLVGVTAAVDLRRLESPAGTSLSWAGAAVFGDCTTYRRLSVPPAGGGDDDARCRELRRLGAEARERPNEVEIELLTTEQSGDRATARLRVRLPGGQPQEVAVRLLRVDGDWLVEPDGTVCAVIPCA